MLRLRHYLTSVTALVFLFGCGSSGALAQSQGDGPPAAFRSLPKPSPDKVTGPEISVLIRTTLVALQQGNFTGNYTVLRDLGALSFRTLNTPVRLGNIYSKIREANLNLSPVVLIDPYMTKKPVIDANQVLMIEGFFPTEPLNIIFRMGFRFEYGEWRLLSLNVGAQEAKDIAASLKNIGSENKVILEKSNSSKQPPVPKEKPTVGQ